MSRPLRTFQEAGAHAMFMTDDWASAFRPTEETQEAGEPTDHVPPDPFGKQSVKRDPEDSQSPLSVGPDVREVLMALKVIHDENTVLRQRVGVLEQMVANPPWLNDLNSNLQSVLRDNASAMVQANNQFMAILIRKLDEVEERLSADEPAFTNILYSNPELFNEISSRPDDENELSVEEEFAAKQKIAEMVAEEHPELFPTDEELEEIELTAEQEEMLAEFNAADMYDGSYERVRTRFEQENWAKARGLTMEEAFGGPTDEELEEKRIRASFDAWKAKEIKWHEFVKAAGGVKNAGMWKKKFTDESLS